MTGTNEAAVRVTAVVVTYDRRDLLAEALEALRAQTRRADRVVVVNNASPDDSSGLVRERFPEAELVELRRNIGGAGGFGAGIAHALAGSDADEAAHGPGLLWLLDDDTVPEPSALAALLDAREAATGPDGPPVLLASRVVWTDGRDHPMNTPRPKPMASAAERARAEAADCVPIRSASFVSILVDAATVRERGLPVADYFLWNDDFEFTTRILRGRRGLLCPGSLVVHKTRVFGGTETDPGARFHLEVRNKLWLFTRSSGLGPVERVLYAGSTLRRWSRTFAASGDRATLRAGLGSGVRAGLFSRPAPTAAVLREAGATVGLDEFEKPKG
ncbi:glycosyltransferase [Spirillospora sp. NPDC052269]